MQEEIERQQQIEADKKALELILAQQQQVKSAPEASAFSTKAEKESQKLEQVQEQKAAIKVNPEQEKLKLQKAKEIYLSLPKGKEEILKYTLDFAAMQALNLLERVVRPWVAKKIKELLGVEEQAMINLVVGHLKSGHATSDSLMTKVGGILDEDSEQFVLKLWQVLLFEHFKIKGGLYAE